MHCIFLAFACSVAIVTGRRKEWLLSRLNQSNIENTPSSTALRSFLLAHSSLPRYSSLPHNSLAEFSKRSSQYKRFHTSRIEGQLVMDEQQSMDVQQSSTSSSSASSIFSNVGLNTELKMQLLTLAANLDRGQSYNPTSSDAYKERMEIATELIRKLIASSPPLPTSLDALDGEWELVFTNVAHGIFRSSPFFLAVQEAYAKYAEPPAPDKALLFFRLHELQTCSWGVSKIGRVAQTIDARSGMLFSEFDTNLFALTVIPILGWFKLLPTFGGSVITASTASLVEDRIEMEVEYTTSRPVNGLSGLRPLPGDVGKQIADAIWNLRVPVKAIWKLLPWNKGRGPKCSVKLVYFDGDMRIVEDPSGELFVYTRPVASRPLPSM